MPAEQTQPAVLPPVQLCAIQYLGVAVFIGLFTLNEQVRRADAQVASGARA